MDRKSGCLFIYTEKIDRVYILMRRNAPNGKLALGYVHPRPPLGTNGKALGVEPDAKE